MNTIISKDTIDTEIIEWHTDNVALKMIPVRSVRIRGGAHILDPKTLTTPHGVATEVSDEALEWLERQPAFIDKINSGVFRVIKGAKARTVDADEEAESGKMIATREISGRPLTPEDISKHGGEINKDGSIDITDGGRDAPARVAQEIRDIQRNKELSKSRPKAKRKQKKG